MNKKDYLNLVKKLTPKEDKYHNYLLSFLMGGLIGAVGEVIKKFLIKFFYISNVSAINYVLIIFIFTSCLLTSLGFFDNLVSKFKCGIIIPITGFAHSIMSSALDYKKDGLITGIGSNFFKLAGSVILYGVISGFIFGIIKVILNVWV